MGDDGAMAEAARDCAVAYAAHYSQRDLVRALHLYKELIASHASARQAGYSRSQIQNVVKIVVPEQELLDAQVELALVCLEREIAPDVELIPLASPPPSRPNEATRLRRNVRSGGHTGLPARYSLPMSRPRGQT